MNVFVIPSWYPSHHHPLEATYFKSQVEKFAEIYPSSNFCISTWGQNEDHLLLKSEDHFKNLKKIVKQKDNEYLLELRPNFLELFTPAFTWSRKILGGNIRGIINSNINNFLKFQERVGRVDIIHAFVGHPAGYLAMELSERFKIPYIITEHMGPFPFKSYLLRNGTLSKYLYQPLKRASKVISVSPALSRDIQKYDLPLPLYIPNFVEEDIFYPSARRPIPPFKFVTCATILYDKGIHHLLKAIENKFKELESVEFIMVGGGPQLDHFKKISRELRVDCRVQWLGERPRGEIPGILNSGHAFLLPSLHENFPVSILEALACGLPVISTICGGPEFILNEHNGILIKPGNVDVLSDAILTMVENYDKYNGLVIRNQFLKEFSSKSVVPKIMNLYEQVLN